VAGHLAESNRFNTAESYANSLVAAQKLQADAWEAFNVAFHSPDAEPYRQAGRDLYRKVLEERIRALYQRGDEQNRFLDTNGAA